MSKLTTLAAAATGYVLGARAGRDRYEQIATQAQRFWSNPKVQQVTQEARDKAPVVGEKLAGKAKQASGKVASAVSKSGDGKNALPDDSAPLPPAPLGDDLAFPDTAAGGAGLGSEPVGGTRPGTLS